MRHSNHSWRRLVLMHSDCRLRKSPGIAEKNGLESGSLALQAAILELLALFLEDGFPIFHEPVERFLRSPLVGDHVVMQAPLFGLQELRVGGLGPEADDH